MDPEHRSKRLMISLLFSGTENGFLKPKDILDYPFSWLKLDQDFYTFFLWLQTQFDLGSDDDNLLSDSEYFDETEDVRFFPADDQYPHARILISSPGFSVPEFVEETIKKCEVEIAEVLQSVPLEPKLTFWLEAIHIPRE
ncbi:MAG TPA: hypothetical protein VLH19_00195 [Patescibacteria group bacterium]|nr:hypothetical protein [Patescibacteria group bacterium]